MLSVPNVVAQITDTTGTGAYSLSGTLLNSRTLASALVDGEVYGYRVYWSNGATAGYEIGFGTWDSGAGTLARTTILNSSNSDSAVSWTAGDKNLEIVMVNEQVALLRRQVQQVALGDETTAAAVAAGLVTWRSPNFPVTLLSAYGEATSGPVGSATIIDINLGGSTVMATNKINIADGESDSLTSGTPAGITTTAIPARSILTADIDQVGSTTAGSGYKITMEFYATGN